MPEFIDIVGPNNAVELFGIRMVGLSGENLMKLAMSIVLFALLFLLSRLLRRVAAFVLRRRWTRFSAFWVRQGTRLVTGALLLIALASIWFDDPTRFATALGLITAGLAFALQKVITAIAGYFVILRGETFHPGDRIVMGGVRGDVISVGLTQTSIMEMGQPPSVQNADPAMWVHSRQYTGRVVTVSNANIFDEPVFNYTRRFPYLWEEMQIPIRYGDDRRRAEEIMMNAARKHTITHRNLTAETLLDLQKRYFLKPEEIGPRVYYQLTDNWLQLSLRFIVQDYGMRDVKDAMSREILEAFDEAGISIASSTMEVVGVPPLNMKTIEG